MGPETEKTEVDCNREKVILDVWFNPQHVVREGLTFAISQELNKYVVAINPDITNGCDPTE